VACTTSGGVVGLSSAMTVDGHAGVARLFDRRVHTGAVVGDQDAVVTAGDRLLDLVDLTLLVAVRLAGGECQLDVLLFGDLRLSTLLHREPEGVGGILGQEHDLDLFRPAVAGTSRIAVAATSGEE
jgi:hypothetical protein